jgi:hypothetical protein
MNYRNEQQRRTSRQVPQDFGAGRASYEEYRPERFPSSHEDSDESFDDYTRERRLMSADERYGGRGDERPFRNSSPYAGAGQYRSGAVHDRSGNDYGRSLNDSYRGGEDYNSSNSYQQSSGYGGFWNQDSAGGRGQSMGQFAGRGPKGYQRSDERIKEEINDRLTAHPGVDASDVEVQVQSGEVTLTGTTPSRHCKRMAEDIAEQCAGVKDVRNEIKVKSGSNGQDWNQQHNDSSKTQSQGATASSKK